MEYGYCMNQIKSKIAFFSIILICILFPQVPVSCNGKINWRNINANDLEQQKMVAWLESNLPILEEILLWNFTAFDAEIAYGKSDAVVVVFFNNDSAIGVLRVGWINGTIFNDVKKAILIHEVAHIFQVQYRNKYKLDTFSVAWFRECFASILVLEAYRKGLVDYLGWNYVDFCMELAYGINWVKTMQIYNKYGFIWFVSLLEYLRMQNLQLNETIIQRYYLHPEFIIIIPEFANAKIMLVLASAIILTATLQICIKSRKMQISAKCK